MGLDNGMMLTDRFASYVGEPTKVVCHAERAKPLRDYCPGLLATEGRRSVEPMAAVTAPAHVSAQHQKLLHFVASATCIPPLQSKNLARAQWLSTPRRPRSGRSATSQLDCH